MSVGNTEATNGNRFVTAPALEVRRHVRAFAVPPLLLKSIALLVDTLPGCYALGCISVMLSKDFQRLGDLAANTIVVYAQNDVPDASLRQVKNEPVRVPLSLEEQQAVVSFGERAPRLNRDRAEELAALMTPVFGDVDADRLRGHAAWIAGGEGKS